MKRPRIILPAAGSARRFGGIPKELLPLGEGVTCLSRMVDLARKLGDPIVVSNRDKLPFHSSLDCDVAVRWNPEANDMWGSVHEALEAGRACGLMLPDTVTRFDVEEVRRRMREHHVVLGCFSTHEPGRFSIVDEKTGEILTKPKDRVGLFRAWGVVFWSATVTDFFLRERFRHYDPAFQHAMRKFGYVTFTLEEYHDLGTFEAYRRYLREAEEAEKLEGRMG